MTFHEIYNEGRDRLEKAGVADALIDAWYLIEYVFQIDRAYYLMIRDENLLDDSSPAVAKFRELIAKRAKRYPLQHLTGTAYFMDLAFTVNEHVLVPRQDTETLVEAAKELLEQSTGEEDAPGVLDMCTGSGCIIISLARLCRLGRAVGADVSGEAVRVAKANASALRAERVEIIQSDMFSHVEGIYDMIVSNPPYIRSGDMPGLMPEVRDHDPVQALDGGEDGLHFYRILARQAPDYLKAGGYMLAEIGYDQAADVTKILQEAGWGQVQVRKDLAGNDRVVIARKR